jgi:neopullulanase
MKKLRLLWIGALIQTLCVYAHAQIQHVEPSNWWVGMKNPIVQLMVHGKDIGETMPIIDYQGVTIQKVSKGDSPNYLFIELVRLKFVSKRQNKIFTYIITPY